MRQWDSKHSTHIGIEFSSPRSRMERSGTIEVVKDLGTFSVESNAFDPLDIVFISAVCVGA